MALVIGPRFLRTLAVAAACLPAARPLGAADEPPREVFRLPFEVGSARLVGLGGAMVGLGGDVNASLMNPAALVSVPRTFDAALSFGGKTQSAFGIAIHPTRKFAAGVFLWGRSAREELIPTTLAPAPSLALQQAILTTPAFGVAWSPDRRYSFGAGCQWRNVSLQEEGAESEKQWGHTCALGFFIQPDNPDAVRFGLVYRTSADVDFDAFGGSTRPTVLRQPDVVSAGVSWRYDLLRNTRMVMSLQPELVRYSQLSAPARDLHDDLDVRFAVEVSLPFGCVTGCGSMAQVRGSILSRAPVPFASLVEADGSEAIQSPKRKNSWAVGVSLALEALFGGNLRLDAAYRHEDETFVAGLAVRFPEAYRADLQHHRRRR